MFIIIAIFSLFGPGVRRRYNGYPSLRMVVSSDNSLEKFFEHTTQRVCLRCHHAWRFCIKVSARPVNPMPHYQLMQVWIQHRIGNFCTHDLVDLLCCRKFILSFKNHQKLQVRQTKFMKFNRPKVRSNVAKNLLFHYIANELVLF